jgi:hypothetical protein
MFYIKGLEFYNILYTQILNLFATQTFIVLFDTVHLEDGRRR